MNQVIREGGFFHIGRAGAYKTRKTTSPGKGLLLCPERAEGSGFMADEAQDQGQQKTDDTTDWKAKYEAMRQHSRDWESKAKANQSAADELEKLKADSQTEQEKALARAQKAEAELEKLKADAERAQTVTTVADEMSVPAEFVQMLNGEDSDELRAQVARIKKLLLAAPTRTDDGGGSSVAKKTNADRFAEALFG